MIEDKGTLWRCDGCGAEQLILVRGNIPKNWSSGRLVIENGWIGPTLQFCSNCWDWLDSSDKKKRSLMMRFFDSVLKRKPTGEGDV